MCVQTLKALSVTSGHGTVEKKLEWAFGLYDLDNSGSISRAEIRAVYESIYSLVEKSDYFKDEVESCTIQDRVERMFTLMDTVNLIHLQRTLFTMYD